MRGSVAARLFLAAVMVHFTPALAESLAEAFADAYSSNPALGAQSARRVRTAQRLVAARSYLKPSVTLEMESGRDRNEDTTTQSFVGRQSVAKTQNEHSGELKITQPLYRGGRTVASIRGAEADIESERSHTRSLEQDVFLAVATSYLDVLRDRGITRLQKQNEGHLMEELRGAREKLLAGQATRTDTAQAAARFATGTAELLSAQAELQASMDRYFEAVGHPPGELLEPSARAIPSLPASLADGEAMLEGQNPDISEARYAATSARYGVAEAHGRMRPEINFVISATQDRYALVNARALSQLDRSDGLSAYLSFQFDLYDPGTARAFSRASHAAYVEAALNVETERRAALSDLREGWARLEAARLRTAALRDAIVSYEVALEGTRIAQAGGTRTLLDVLDAQRELTASRVSLERARHDELLASFSIAASLGQLTAAAIGLHAAMFEPGAHIDER